MPFLLIYYKKVEDWEEEGTKGGQSCEEEEVMGWETNYHTFLESRFIYMWKQKETICMEEGASEREHGGAGEVWYEQGTMMHMCECHNETHYFCANWN